MTLPQGDAPAPGPSSKHWCAVPTLRRWRTALSYPPTRVSPRCIPGAGSTTVLHLLGDAARCAALVCGSISALPVALSALSTSPQP